MRTPSLCSLLLLSLFASGCAIEEADSDELIDESESELTRKTYYVSDLSPRTIENGFGPIELNRAIGQKAEGDGGKISIRGKSYSKGLGVHARSDVRVNLDGKCSSFRATIGIDDQVNAAPAGKATVSFSVLADGENLFQSGTVDKTQAGVAINVDITGKKELQLVVQSQGDNQWDAADWASARVLCSSKPVVPPPVKPNPKNSTGDLFTDPNLLNTPSMQNPFSLFAPGAEMVALSKFVVSIRDRHCTKMTGCSGWTVRDPGYDGDGSAKIKYVPNANQIYFLLGGTFFINPAGSSSTDMFSDFPFSSNQDGPSMSARYRDTTMRLTADYFVAWATYVPQDKAYGNWDELEIVTYARVNPNETPKLSTTATTATASW